MKPEQIKTARSDPGFTKKRNADMTTTYEIKIAKTQAELNELLENAAAERNCELSGSMTFAENANFLREEAPKAGNGEVGMNELADILEAAETRWFELGS
jgi:hypothetical protein